MRIWLPIITLGVTFYAFFDCARTEQDAIVKGPKWFWLILIIFFELIGAIAWFIWCKPRKRGGGGGKKKILPPDDDPDFLRKI